MENLVKLNLERNNIAFIGITGFSGLVSLTHLDLTGNWLANVHPDVFEPLPYPPGLKEQILLDENPLMCDCELRHLVSWISRTPFRVKNSKNLRCSFVAGKFIYLDQIHLNIYWWMIALTCVTCFDHETSGDVTGSFLECILSRMLYIRTRSVSFQLNPPEVTLTEDGPHPFSFKDYKYIFLYIIFPYYILYGPYIMSSRTISNDRCHFL